MPKYISIGVKYIAFIVFGVIGVILFNYWVFFFFFEVMSVEKFKPRLIELTSFRLKLLIRFIMNKPC